MLDALGDAGASALGVTGEVQAFQLPPKTYAVQATTTTPKGLSGSATAPIELYEDQPVTIELLPRGRSPWRRSFPSPKGTRSPSRSDSIRPLGTITSSPGPRSRSNRKTPSPWPRSWTRLVRCARSSGQAKQLTSSPGSTTSATSALTRRATPGFVRLTAGESERVSLKPPPPDSLVEELASAMGGRVARRLPHHGRRRYCLGAPRHGRRRPDWRNTSPETSRRPWPLGPARAELRNGSGVAVFAVGVGRDGRTDLDAVRHVKVAIWRAGEPVVGTGLELQPSAAGVAGRVLPRGCRAALGLLHGPRCRSDGRRRAGAATAAGHARCADRQRSHPALPVPSQHRARRIVRREPTCGVSSTSSGCCSPAASTSQTASHGSSRQQRPRTPSQESSPAMCSSAWASMKSSAPSPQRSSRLLPP